LAQRSACRDGCDVRAVAIVITGRLRKGRRTRGDSKACAGKHAAGELGMRRLDARIDDADHNTFAID
jgi:hypothetical protein